jgi:hypothetical protein
MRSKLIFPQWCRQDKGLNKRKITIKVILGALSKINRKGGGAPYSHKCLFDCIRKKMCIDDRKSFSLSIFCVYSNKNTEIDDISILKLSMYLDSCTKVLYKSLPSPRNKIEKRGGGVLKLINRQTIAAESFGKKILGGGESWIVSININLKGTESELYISCSPVHNNIILNK